MQTTAIDSLTPAVYPTRVTHLQRSPVHYYAEHRSYSWYVDVDQLPRLPRWLRPFARFEAVDHLDGAPQDTLRQRVDTCLARHGIFLPGGRVTALLMPRVLGRAFNPLSLFWCHDSDGALRCVIAEVQTVDGHRYAYLLPPAEDGPAAVTDAVANPPFTDDSGYYLVRAPRPGEHLDLAVSLHRDNHAALVATWRGSRRAATVGQILRLQLTSPLAPQMARLSMRLRALMLRLRGAGQAPRGAAESGPGLRTTSPSGWAAGNPSWAPS